MNSPEEFARRQLKERREKFALAVIGSCIERGDDDEEAVVSALVIADNLITALDAPTRPTMADELIRKPTPPRILQDPL